MLGSVFRTRPPQVPDGVSIIAFGDVHGCLAKLEDLFERIEKRIDAHPQHRHVVISLGDLVDRGPDSAGVVERLIEGIPGCELVLIRGNHEQMMLDFVHDCGNPAQWPREGCFETMASYGLDGRRLLAEGRALAEIRQGLPDLRQAFLKRVPRYHLEFLARSSLYLTCGDYFFVHAGIRPSVALAQQREHDLLWIRGEFLHSNTQFEKIIVHGHTPTNAVEFHNNRINIDTGACLGGPLSAVLFEQDSVKVF